MPVEQLRDLAIVSELLPMFGFVIVEMKGGWALGNDFSMGDLNTSITLLGIK